MLGKTFSIMMLVSFASALITGNMQKMSLELVNSLSKSVELCFSLLGMMCFWNGIMNVIEGNGILEKIERILMPVIKIIYGKNTLSQESALLVSASISANMLGLGNAALPIGISAVKSMQKNKGEVASDEAITFAVMNTVPFQLIPSTLIALRTKHNSSNPFDVVIPIWICSLIITACAVAVCKMLSKMSKRSGNIDA